MLYTDNRNRLISKTNGALIVLTAYEAMQLSADMPAPYVQEANFWWLTGIDRPGWRVVIDGSRQRATLVRPHLTEMQKVFDGGLSDEQALRLSGANDVVDGAEFEQYLVQLARQHSLVMTVDNKASEHIHPNPAQQKLNAQLTRIFNKVEICNGQISELRAIKQPEELERINRAIKQTIDAFRVVKKNWQTYKFEYQVEAAFTYEFKHRNSQHAYAPIVAAGPRACTLHYDQNAASIVKRDVVVIDIGAKVDGYAADITRSFCSLPTKRVLEVHTKLVEAQRGIIDLLKPGLLAADYLKQADEIMINALYSLGLVKSLTDFAGYRKYLPHAISHGLGVDVHDSLGAPRQFMPGMVLTVEPGIYIPEESIGMRIEDDILITDTGCNNLSLALSTGL